MTMRKQKNNHFIVIFRITRKQIFKLKIKNDLGDYLADNLEDSLLLCYFAGQMAITKEIRNFNR